MKKLMGVVALSACVVLSGCGRKGQEGSDAASDGATSAAQDPAQAARDADPVRVAKDFWQALTGTNVADMVALCTDEGIDLLATDVDSKKKAKLYRDYAAISSDLFSGFSVTSADLVGQRADRARVAVSLSAPSGVVDQIDLSLRRIGKKWRVEPFEEKGF